MERGTDARTDSRTDSANRARPRVLALVGPTASGKSALALALSRLLPIEIVSCDSLMVYAGMDIGTGKPTAAERAEVPHHLLDVATPAEAFHAARWAELARTAIDTVAARGRLPVIVGGTGLYLRALVGGLFQAPPPDEAIRQRHREEAAREGIPALHARLAGIDPEAAARIETRDLVRVSRALEIFEQTGETITALHRRPAPATDVDCRTVVLDPSLDQLRPAIGRRFDEMMAAGLLDETRALRAVWGGAARPLQALGYKQMGQLLDGALPEEAAVGAAQAATVGYARRQRTFFRKFPAAWRAPVVPEAEALRAWWWDGAPDRR